MSSSDVTTRLLQHVQDVTGACKMSVLLEFLKGFHANGIDYKTTAAILGLDENFIKQSYAEFTTIPAEQIGDPNVYIVPIEREVKDILYYKVNATSSKEAYDIALDYCKTKGDPRTVIYSLHEPMIQAASIAFHNNSPFVKNLRIEAELPLSNKKE